MKRKIIKIDEERCNGCGLCIPNCPEGALQIIDGKARLISDLFCDGLGACIGYCPRGAITIEEREAEPYSEEKVMENIVRQGENVIKAHIKHLREHNDITHMNEAINFLKKRGIKVRDIEDTHQDLQHMRTLTECPGAKMMEFKMEQKNLKKDLAARVESQLRQWPIQLHLINPDAPYYQKRDVLLVADCVAYALGNFHQDYLKGKSLAIACPKLDRAQDVYIGKIKSWFEDAEINTLTVIVMQVPCCKGLLHLAKQAAEMSRRKVPIKVITVSLQGEILQEEWV